MALSLSRGAMAGAVAGRHVRRVSRTGLLSIACWMAALVLYLHSLAPSITMAHGAGGSGELASTA